MKKLLFAAFFLSLTSFQLGQEFLSQSFYETYENYREQSITTKRSKHADIVSLIENRKSNNLFIVKEIGKSLDGRSINMLSVGSGGIHVLLWSQMHGDEPTATMALFDLFNFFSADDDFNDFRDKLYSNLTIHFIPMLNPDGAEVFRRRNALNIDLNRDAMRLQFPETIALKSVRDSLNPVFGFNLHDQSPLYTAGRNFSSATISFLAPAYNYEKTINDVRAKTMQVIVNMYDELSKFIPGHLGRYSDDFEPRAFGDNMVKWGTGSVLIESGGWKNDSEKQFIRQINYVALLVAFQSIAEGFYQQTPVNRYEEIPENDRLLFNVLFRNLTINYNEKNYLIDLGINHKEKNIDDYKSFYTRSEIADIGDLSTFYGYEEYDCTDMVVVPGKIYPQTFSKSEEIEELNFTEILDAGYTFIRIEDIELRSKYSKYPINLIVNGLQFESSIGYEEPANFIIQKNEEIHFVVVNGYVYNAKVKRHSIRNGLIFK
jgi:hypothetical protein